MTAKKKATPKRKANQKAHKEAQKQVQADINAKLQEKAKAAQETAPVYTGDGYTKELGDFICNCLIDGLSLRRIHTIGNMPAPSTVRSWALDYPDFGERYARAMELRADALAEEILDTAQDACSLTAQGDRVKIDGLKWVAAKANHKKYGDKVDVSGDFNVKSLPEDELDRRIAAAASKAGILGTLAGEGAPEGAA